MPVVTAFFHVWKKRQVFFRFAWFYALSLACLVQITFYAEAWAGNLTVSWAGNTEPDLAGYKIHYGQAAGSYTQQVDAKLALKYVFSNLVEGQTYYFVVTAYDTAHNESAYSVEVSAQVPSTDKTPPTIVRAKALAQNQVEVKFSEPVTLSSSQKLGNYSITPQIVVTQAVLQADNRTVILTTSHNLDGKAYTLTVKDVIDRAVPANKIVSPTMVNYEFHTPDNIAPTLVRVSALAADQVEVRFSELVAAASAEQVSNYNIAPQVKISAAALQADGLTVRLATTSHVDSATYTLSVQNIQDRATPPNAIATPATKNYQFRVPDTTPPTLVSARALDQNQVEVQFSEPITAASAVKISNYGFQPALAINAAILQTNSRTVILNTAKQADGTTYTLSVQNIFDRATPANSIALPANTSYQFTLGDRKPPAVVEVRALDHTKVELRFDEAVTRGSAENLANYSIDQGVNLSSVTLHSDERGVLLNTSPQVDGVTYQMTVRRLADRATPPNVMSAASTHAYTFVANDIQPARVTSVALTNLTTLVITFDERITPASAENTNNYRLNENMRVVAARLDAFEQEVTLTVTEHVYNRTYLLSLSGIVDASSNANGISDTLRLPYSLQGSGDKQNGNLTISAWTPTYFLMDTLRVGQRHYMDFAATVTHVPMRLRNKLMFRTANRDRQMKAEHFFEFNLNHLADVYVAYDSRAEEVPQWLRDNFVDNNQKIRVALPGGSGVQMKVWKGRFSPGRVQLGANLANGVQTSAALNMYFVLVDDLELNGAGQNEQPQLYELANNYPNPLRLNSGATQTVIECRLRQEGRVVVKVYNMLGQAVRTLHDGVLSAGTHPLIWNGRDDNAEAVPSGKYLYALEILEEIKQGDFTLTAALNRQTRVMTVLR
ncbi:MAG: Ig-like domain-containing protein [candidate division KSB1 bacterium]